MTTVSFTVDMDRHTTIRPKSCPASSDGDLDALRPDPAWEGELGESPLVRFWDPDQPRDASGRWTRGGSTATAIKKPAIQAARTEKGVQTVPDEVLDAQLDALYPVAESAKAEVDAEAHRIAVTVNMGSRVAKAPLKGKVRAKQKAVDWFDSDVTKLDDIARNTIVANPVVHDKIVGELTAKGAAVRHFKAEENPMGYSGVNLKLPTSAGMVAEVQLNSPAMIYAKEPEKTARGILGDALYDKLRAASGVEGGKGHALYEEYRALPEKHPRRAEIEAESRAYYDHMRGFTHGRIE
jgi:hypothetical protein